MGFILFTIFVIFVIIGIPLFVIYIAIHIIEFVKQKRVERICNQFYKELKNLNIADLISNFGLIIDSKKLIKAYFENILTLKDQVIISILEIQHKYTINEIIELIFTTAKETKKAKLADAKRVIKSKVLEAYNLLPSDDRREQIPDDVKLYVWQCDKGNCVKCGSNENLEYDHIIPFSKGGSNSARNLQLLCEKCNREKSDNIA